MSGWLLNPRPHTGDSRFELLPLNSSSQPVTLVIGTLLGCLFLSGHGVFKVRRPCCWYFRRHCHCHRYFPDSTPKRLIEGVLPQILEQVSWQLCGPRREEATVALQAVAHISYQHDVRFCLLSCFCFAVIGSPPRTAVSMSCAIVGVRYDDICCQFLGVVVLVCTPPWCGSFRDAVKMKTRMTDR